MAETEPIKGESLKNMLEKYLKIFNNLISIEIASEEIHSEIDRRTTIQNFSKEILSVIPRRVGAIYFEDITTVRTDIDPAEDTDLEIWGLEDVFEYLNSLEEKIRDTFLDNENGNE